MRTHKFAETTNHEAEKCDEKTSPSVVGRLVYKEMTEYYVFNFTRQPRALFFNHPHSQTARIIPHLHCLFRGHLSELMAYFAALTLSTPRI